jgi:YfiH family protein
MIHPGNIVTEMDPQPLAAAILSDLDGIRHGFFTRRGGVSKGIYASLNCGFGSADRREDVTENRRRAAQALFVPSAHLITPHQIHSATALLVSAPWTPGEAPPADAVITATPGLAVGVLVADCAPVLLADPKAGVVGAAHAGWKGALGGIIEAAVAAMEEAGASRSRILAAIGPAISEASYEVGPDFQKAFAAEDASFERYFSLPSGQDRPHFDLPGFVRRRLKDSGVAHIENLECCTYQNESLCFSYRRSLHRGEPDYGRQISAIVIS